MSFVSDFIFQSGDTNTWGSRGYVAHLQPAAGGRQPKSLNHQVCLFIYFIFFCAILTTIFFQFCFITYYLRFFYSMKTIWCHKQESADRVLHRQCGQFTCAHHTDFMCGDDRLWFPGLSAQSQRNKHPGEPVCEGQSAFRNV